MDSKTLFDTSKDRQRATLLAFGVGTLMVCVLIVLLLSTSPHVVKLVNLFYLASTAGLGLWLYMSNPPLYLSFVWWMWLVSPFIRRLVDYKLDTFTPPNEALILLAPYVVTVLSAFTLFRYGRLLFTKTGAPFLFGLLAVLYSYIVGLPLNGSMSASLGLLEWLPPLLIGFHVYALWRQYPEHRKSIRSTFLGAALVLGTYGLIQFFVLPPWDAFWMVGSRMNSIGPAEPLAIRVFSMQEAPGAYAYVLIPSLLLIFDSRSLLGKVSIVPGFLSFLLTFVRSAWGGWMVGMAVLTYRFTGRLRMRLIAISVVAALVIVPATLINQTAADRTTDRLETLGNLDEDGSLQARQHMYQTYTIGALTNPLGAGLGSTGFDSGYVTILWQAGWLGSLFYLGSLFWLAWKVCRPRPGEKDDTFTIILSSTVISFIALMAFGQAFGVVGSVLWAFMGLILAGRKYEDEKASNENASSSPVSSDFSAAPAPSYG